jgi:amino acid transporter
MEDNIDFKGLWAKQSVGSPNAQELFMKLHRHKKTNLRKLLLTNFVLIATSVFIGFIWYYFQPQFISTKIGIVLSILAMVVYLFAYNQLLPSFRKTTTDQSNQEYLHALIKIRTKQEFLQTKMLHIYFILLSVGICLYMIEYASMMPMFWAIVTYVLTLFWMGFNWFYIHPKTVKKQQAKLNELISKMESLTQQLNKNE